MFLARGDDSVGEHQATLGVGVQHLDGLAALDAQHVVRFDRLPDGMFSARHSHAVTRSGESESRGGEHDGEHGGRTGHVVLHSDHGCRRLERDSAGVEGDALSDEGEVAARAFGRVADLDQPRRMHGALPDTDDAAEVAGSTARPRPAPRR